MKFKGGGRKEKMESEKQAWKNVEKKVQEMNEK